MRSRDGHMMAIHGEPNRTVFPHMTRIESLTNRTVSIETQLTDDNLRKCDPQKQSSLFKLPGELRNLIFQLASIAYDDPMHYYGYAEYYYRPGHHARHIIPTNLLLTCRRAWLEANHLPMQQARHFFWFKDRGRRPVYLDDFQIDEEERLANFISALTINNRKNLKEIQIFAQMHWLQGHFPYRLQDLVGSLGVCPEILTVTVRHTDWVYWQYDRPLDSLAEQQWLKKLLRWPALPRLRQIRLELETLESRVDELRPVVAKISQKFGLVKRSDHFGDRYHAVLQPSLPEWTWSGPPNPGNEMHTTYIGLEKLHYRVVTLVWQVDPFPSENAAAKREFGIEDDALNLTHVPGPKLPILSIQSPNRTLSQSETRPDQPFNSSAKRFIQEWDDIGSLLKFVPWISER